MDGSIHIDLAKYTQKLLVIKKDRSMVELSLGLMLILIGLGITYQSLTAVNELCWGFVLIFLFCGIIAYLGLHFIISGSESIVIEMNKETGKGTYVRKALLTNESLEFDLSEINGVHVVEHYDICFASDIPYCVVTISTKNREFRLFSYAWRPSFCKSIEQVADETTDFPNISRSDVTFIP